MATKVKKKAENKKFQAQNRTKHSNQTKAKTMKQLRLNTKIGQSPWSALLRAQPRALPASCAEAKPREEREKGKGGKGQKA